MRKQPAYNIVTFFFGQARKMSFQAVHRTRVMNLYRNALRLCMNVCIDRLVHISAAVPFPMHGRSATKFSGSLKIFGPVTECIHRNTKACDAECLGHTCTPCFSHICFPMAETHFQWRARRFETSLTPTRESPTFRCVSLMLARLR
jgi:hypothetical protein